MSAPGIASAQEMLINAGFDGRAANGIATGWKDNSGWADVDVKYDLDNDSVLGSSQHIRCQRVASGALQFVQPNVSLVKGQGYRISIWIKGTLDGPLEIMLRKRGAPYTTYARKVFRISDQWKKYEFIATVGENDPGAFFMVRFAGSAEIWLDNASLQPVSVAAATPPEERNLIANGSFEVGLDRWAVNVREIGGYRNEMQIAFADVRPSIEIGDMPHGTRAMHIDVPPHGAIAITTPPFKVIPGYNYTVSLWLKAEHSHEVSVKLKSFGHGAHVMQGRRFKVGPQWRRYQFTSAVPANAGDQYILLIESKVADGVSIDGVQVTAGKNGQFTPSSPIEVGFSRKSESPIFYKNESALLELCIAEYESSMKQDYTLEVRSTDFFGAELELVKQKITPLEGSVDCRSISHPSDRTGYFRISAKISRESDVLDQATMAIGVVPNPSIQPSEASPFGGHARFSPASLKAVKMLGVSWLRMHPPLGTKWFVVEPEKGRFKFIDEPIRYAKDQGFHILGSLDSTPRWASSAPSNLKSELADGFRAYPPTQMSDWENYVTNTVGHYKGVIDHWEIWNEPDSGGFFKLRGIAEEKRKPGEYVKLVKTAYQAAKRANPGSVVVGGVGTGRPPLRWIEKLVDRDILDYLDVLSFHYYTDGRPGDALDVPTSKRVDEIRALVTAQGRTDMRYWETESGLALEVCSDDAKDEGNEYCAGSHEAVAFITRSYFAWLSSGVERWFFYHMFFPDRTDRTTLAGFFEWDRSPKPLAIGYAIMSSLLSETTYVESIDRNDGVAGIKFSGDDKYITAYWVKDWGDKVPHMISLASDPHARQTKILNVMGIEEASFDRDQTIDVEVGRIPIYRVDVF